MSVPILLVATVACVLANGLVVAAKVVKAPFVVQNCAEVGVGPRWIPYLALLEGAGALALVLGLAGASLLGLAGAVGLVLFFIGAVLTHVRARVFHSIAFPATFLALAVAAVGYFASSV